MKLTDKGFMSYWAYHQCRKGNDIKEIRNLINIDTHIFWYCIFISNRKDMRDKLKDLNYWRIEYRKLCFKAFNEKKINEIN